MMTKNDNDNNKHEGDNEDNDDNNFHEGNNDKMVKMNMMKMNINYITPTKD